MHVCALKPHGPMGLRMCVSVCMAKDTAGAGTERPKRKRDDTGVNDGDGESLYAQMRSDLKTKAHAKRFAGWSDASAS
eukprot:m.780445 g.780445  ORF g.780445 m.780445 type:complete len:78 (+) comp23281_c0_seq9:279-512(+)